MRPTQVSAQTVGMPASMRGKQKVHFSLKVKSFNFIGIHVHTFFKATIIWCRSKIQILPLFIMQNKITALCSFSIGNQPFNMYSLNQSLKWNNYFIGMDEFFVLTYLTTVAKVTLAFQDIFKKQNNIL